MVGTDAAFDYLAQWRDEPETTELILPSGKRVLVREPDLAALARQGLIPNHLLPVVETFVMEGVTRDTTGLDATAQAKPGERLTRYADFLAYVDAYAVAAVAQPPLSFDGQRPGTLAVSRFSATDRMHIWRWGAGLVQALADFPGDGAGPLATVAAPPDGGEVRDAAEPSARPDAAG